MRRKPAKTPTKRKTPSARAVKVAAAAIAGKSTTEIGSELGVSRSQAWRILNSNETQQILVLLVNEHFSTVESLHRDALRVIGEAMNANRPTVVTKEGASIEGGPDHFARLTAVARYVKLLTAGRPTPKPPEQDPQAGTMTLQQIEETLGANEKP